MRCILYLALLITCKAALLASYKLAQSGGDLYDFTGNGYNAVVSRNGGLPYIITDRGYYIQDKTTIQFPSNSYKFNPAQPRLLIGIWIYAINPGLFITFNLISGTSASFVQIHRLLNTSNGRLRFRIFKEENSILDISSDGAYDMWRFNIFYIYAKSGDTIFDLYNEPNRPRIATCTISNTSIENSSMTWSINSVSGGISGFIYEVYLYNDIYTGQTGFFATIVQRTAWGKPCWFKAVNQPCFSTDTDPYIYTSGSSCNVCSVTTGSCYTSLSGCSSPSCVPGVTPECLCIDNCIDCSKNSSNVLVCSECDTGYSILEGSPNYSCTTTCPLEHYKDTSSFSTCKRCLYNCNICRNDTFCTECISGYYLKNGDCVLECGDRYYLSDFSCLACERNCKTCSSHSLCSLCNAGYYLSNSDCFPCRINCKTCSSDIDCTSCESGLYLKNQDCIPNCGYGYYSSGSSCLACESNCKTCSSDIECTSCDSGLYLKNQVCVTYCGDGYYSSGSSCLACESNCKTCSSGTVCRECYLEFYLQNKDCVISCSDSYFPLYNECKRCKDNCSACESDTYCNECMDGYYLDTSSCKPCNLGCNKCNSLNECEECGSDYLLKDGICVLDCGQGYYSNLSNCEECPNDCLDCSSATNCLDQDFFILDYSYIITQASLLVALIVSIATNCSDSILYLIGCIQLQGYSLLYNIPIPSKSIKVMKGFYPFLYIPNLIQYFNLDKSSLKNKRFEQIGIKSEVIFINSGKLLSFILALFLIIILLRIMRYLTRKLRDDSVIKKLVNKLSQELEWNLIIGLLIQVSIELTTSSLINIKYVDFSYIPSIIGFCISIILLVILIQIILLLSPIKLLFYYLSNYQEIRGNVFDMRYKVLHITMKTEKIEYFFYNILYLSRRILHGIVIIILPSSPYIQVVINSSVSIGLCYFIIMFKPFKNKLDYILKLYIEICYAMSQSLIGLLLKEDLNSDLHEAADWALVLLGYSVIILPTSTKVIILAKDAIYKLRGRDRRINRSIKNALNNSDMQLSRRDI